MWQVPQPTLITLSARVDAAPLGGPSHDTFAVFHACCLGSALSTEPLQECLLKATQLLGRVAHAEQNKDALREAGAVVALLKLLRPRTVDPALAEAVCQALTILAVNNEINQDYIRCAAAGSYPCCRRPGRGGVLEGYLLSHHHPGCQQGDQPGLHQVRCCWL